MSSATPNHPPAGQRDGATTRDGAPPRDIAPTRAFSDPPAAGRGSFPDGGFLPEARTMEVSVRSTDQHGAPIVPMLVDRAVLLRMDGVQAGLIIGLEQFPFTVGRHPTNTLRVDEDSISRFHARIIKQGDEFIVEDLSSRNGTFVAGKRVTRATLDHDGWLQFGPRVSFRFSLTDVREERLLRKLYESSTRDALTGAYNRLHFEERLRAEVAYAVRHRAQASLLLIDLDHFKRVNDTYGHPAGDAVLKRAAEACTRALRTEDVFARFGGEEFAVVLRGIELKGAARLAERLRQSLAAEIIEHDGHQIKVTLSAGCASMACCVTPSADELVGIADRRLYAAKAQGRDRIDFEG
ncbi:MAG TPA: GGDEF domain-containing protein [Polyangiaceae bacterium]|nr:GGDEF domain-containing protein [Polyangiaceae bacterium]